MQSQQSTIADPTAGSRFVQLVVIADRVAAMGGRARGVCEGHYKHDWVIDTGRKSEKSTSNILLSCRVGGRMSADEESNMRDV